MIIDTDNDGVFADETPIGGATTVIGNIVQFSGVSGLTNGLRFTIGTADATNSSLLGPGPTGPGGVGRQYAIADGSTQVGYAGGGGGGNTDFTYGQTEPQDLGRGSGGGSPNRGNGSAGVVIVRWT